MTGFSTLNTAVTGLTAAQRAMDIAGQNIVNANTPGYSRQRVELTSVGAATSATFHSGNEATYGGVNIADIGRVRDAFLEAMRAAAGSRQAALTAQTSSLAGAQQLLAEPGETGLQNTLDQFYSAWHEVATNPSEPSTGSVVINKGLAVADQLRYVANGISAQWSTSHDALANVVAEANQAAADLAALNGKIAEGTVGGRPVNELLDRRDGLVRTLGELVGGVAVPGEDGQVSISVNGITMVAATAAEALTLSGANDLSNVAADPPSVLWGTTGVPLESGAAAGHLAVLRTDLPNLRTALDGVATSLRDAVNAVHLAGFTLSGAAGGTFFDGADAATLTVVPTGPAELAVSRSAGDLDGSNAMAIADLSDDAKASAVLGGAQSPSSRYRDLASALGVQVQSLVNASKVQESVVAASDDAVQSNAGVSLDEEMTNMLLFQRSYQAAARVITTIDEMMDTLVNRTGMVGR